MFHCQWCSHPLWIEGTRIDVRPKLLQLSSQNKEFGKKKFVKRHFMNGEAIRLEDMKEKLAMGAHRDRFRMTVLLFLGSVICAQTKVGVGANDVLAYFQRALDDLGYCKTFPWGRYSFDYMVKEISHTMDHFGGLVKEKTLWPLPGFCIPLEVSNRTLQRY